MPATRVLKRRSPPALAIIAGSGAMPVAVAEAALYAGRPVCVIAIAESESDPALARFPLTQASFCQIGRILKTIGQERCRDLVIVGSVNRPNLLRLRFDLGGIRNAPQLFRLLLGGDDSILSAIVHFFENKGLNVMGAQEIAPDLLAGSGPLGRIRPASRDDADIALGRRVLSALGDLDVGQGVVVAREYVLAVEAAEGTDRMLERAGTLRQWGGTIGGRRAGVLVKCAKSGQDRRVDMPTIGPETVRRAAKAGLRGIAVSARDVLVAERAETVRVADDLGLFLVGIEM